MKTILRFLSRIGISDTDKADMILQKHCLVYQAVLMSSGGVVWCLLMLFNGRFYQALIPFGYIILSIINLSYFGYSRNFVPVKTIQTLISLLLPFLFQFALGGFVASGGVMLWAFLSLAVAVTYNSSKDVMAWLLVYVLLTILSGIFDAKFSAFFQPGDLLQHSVLFFVVNIVTISIIVLLLINFMYNEKNNALYHLEQTQQQLVQSEKLASLGALTAGIAHEIKNPLNFVNNFSQLSSDLVDEFIQTNNETERIEIAGLLKQNLQKINEHGKRADNIVKSMLQHSRSGTGEKQPTDINKLCEEYLNLAYHGMRASNSEFNCTLSTNFAENVPLINLVTQDISRVILNLLNNAFYAMMKRSELAKQNEEYKPVIILFTNVSDKDVSIIIHDNGIGIPSAISEKIFEPFFTTKPSGQGTGLGLSLSYDIIKAHGGVLKVRSRENEFTEFIIIIPR